MSIEKIPIHEIGADVALFHFTQKEKEELMNGSKDGRKWTEEEIAEKESQITNRINQSKAA